ncbi:Tat pathway signal sequence domain protein [Streptomycetaceae bacterium NBC_01309]
MNSRAPEPGDIPAEEKPPHDEARPDAATDPEDAAGRQDAAGPRDAAEPDNAAEPERRSRLGRVLVGAGLSATAALVSVAIAIPLGASGESRTPTGPAAKPSGAAASATSSAGPSSAGAGTGSSGGATGPAASAPPEPGVPADEVPADSEPMGPAPAKGTGRDPLTPDEIDAALRIAVDPKLRESARTATGAVGPEPLTVDLADPAPEDTDPDKAPRRADVYFYNYADNTLVKRVVNLTTGKLERSAQAPNMQPAPSKTETAEALRLLVASPAGASLKAQYKSVVGSELTGPEQLEANGSSYIAGPGDKATGQCGAHRCLVLFVKVRGGVYLDTTRTVVDLSARSVIPPS